MEGEWWCSLLARCEHADAYPLGRETYVIPVSWPRGDYPSFEPVQLQQVVSSENRVFPKQLLSRSPKPVPQDVQLDSPHTLWLRTPQLETVTPESDLVKLILKATPTTLGCAEVQRKSAWYIRAGSRRPVY